MSEYDKALDVEPTIRESFQRWWDDNENTTAAHCCGLNECDCLLAFAAGAAAIKPEGGAN